LSIGIFDLEIPCSLIILFKANGNVYSKASHFLGKLTIFSFDELHSKIFHAISCLVRLKLTIFSFDQLRFRRFHAISCLVRFIGSKHKFDLFINGWKNL
jgi:hypothetical protein